MKFLRLRSVTGIATGHEGMKYSLVSREIIADSVEIMAKAHQFDALVLIPNCDKAVPGMGNGGGRAEYPVNHYKRRPNAFGKVQGLLP